VTCAAPCGTSERTPGCRKAPPRTRAAAPGVAPRSGYGGPRECPCRRCRRGLGAGENAGGRLERITRRSQRGTWSASPPPTGSARDYRGRIAACRRTSQLPGALLDRSTCLIQSALRPTASIQADQPSDCEDFRETAVRGWDPNRIQSVCQIRRAYSALPRGDLPTTLSCALLRGNSTTRQLQSRTADPGQACSHTCKVEQPALTDTNRVRAGHLRRSALLWS
jgi:hypothetical protein